MATTQLAVWPCLDSLVCHDGGGLLAGVAKGRWGPGPFSICCSACPESGLDSSLLHQAPVNVCLGRHYRSVGLPCLERLTCPTYIESAVNMAALVSHTTSTCPACNLLCKSAVTALRMPQNAASKWNCVSIHAWPTLCAMLVLTSVIISYHMSGQQCYSSGLV